MDKIYVVVFKTHFWDDFTRRQFERFRACARSGDIVIQFDATRTAAPSIGAETVIAVDHESLKSLRLMPVAVEGPVLYFNADYADYVVRSRLKPYDYYISVEYDVATNIDFDELIDKIHGDKIDYASRPIVQTPPEWPWYRKHTALYGADMLVYLPCFTVFSARALDVLLLRRQDLGVQFQSGALTSWPITEGFVPNEAHQAGFKTAVLDQYGSCARYSHWPPTDEADLVFGDSPEFVHPVLTGPRFVRKLISLQGSIWNFLRLDGPIWPKLRRYDPWLVLSALLAALHGRLLARIYHLLDPILDPTGLHRPWNRDAPGAK